MDTQEFNRKVIEEFRANDGVVGGPMAGMPLLLLTTTGARTGLERINPLAYLADGEDYVVIASFAGAPNSPPWFHNLAKNPSVTVELGDETFEAEAVVTQGADRDALFAEVCGRMPVFAEYQARTERTIPVVVLDPID